MSAKNNQLIIRNDLILVHAVQLKPTTKNGIYWCKCCDHFSILRVTRMKKLMMIMMKMIQLSLHKEPP